MRKWIATGLLGLNRSIYKLACRIYPPRVTETTVPAFNIGWSDGAPGRGASYYHLPAESMSPERRESRGYEN